MFAGFLSNPGIKSVQCFYWPRLVLTSKQWNRILFRAQLQVWVCLLPEALVALVITRHLISDSQLDVFLNQDSEIRDGMTVKLQWPFSSVSKWVCLLCNLPTNPFTVWKRGTGAVWTLLVSHRGVSKPLFSLVGQSKPLHAGSAGRKSHSPLTHCGVFHPKIWW